MYRIVVVIKIKSFTKYVEEKLGRNYDVVIVKVTKILKQLLY